MQVRLVVASYRQGGDAILSRHDGTSARQSSVCEQDTVPVRLYEGFRLCAFSFDAFFYGVEFLEFLWGAVPLVSSTSYPHVRHGHSAFLTRSLHPSSVLRARRSASFRLLRPPGLWRQ